MRLDGRRLVRALVLGCLAFLLVGGGTGFALAAGEDDVLVVPAPRPGDRATYTLRDVVLEPDAVRRAHTPARIEYEWLPQRWIADRDLNERLVLPLRYTVRYDPADDPNVYVREATYDAFTHEPVSEIQANAHAEVSNVFFGGLNPFPESLREPRTTVTRYEGYHGPRGACGWLTPLHGEPYAGGAIEVAGSCHWPDGPERRTYVPVPGAPGEGQRFQAQDDARFLLEYTHGNPFPVQASLPLTELLPPAYTVGRNFLLTLQSWSPGSGGYPPVDASQVRPGLGPAPVVPRTPWGLDDSGVAHRFPLSAAYAAALDQPAPTLGAEADPRLPEWLAAHPGAYLAHASTQEYRDRAGQAFTWWNLVWTDGVDRLGKQVSYGPRGVENFLLPAQTGESAQVNDWDGAGFPYPEYGLVAPDRVPAALPRVADLMQRFTAVTGTEAPNMYGFGIMCADAACSSPWVGVTAGVATQSFQGVFADADRLVLPYSQSYSNIQASEDGRMRGSWSEAASQDAVFPVLPGTRPAPSDERSPDAASLGPAWVLPDSAAATGISLVALLVSALYYFWPAVKGLPALAGFSRIEDGKVLEHPTRRRIHDAIQSEPGIHFQALARKAAVGRGTLEHHLRKLVAADLVTTRKAPGYTCYFPKGRLDRRMLDAAPSLRSDGSRAVLHAVAVRPGASSRDLALQLGLAPSTVSYHLKRLEGAGLVAPGAKAGVRVTPLGEQAAA